MHLLPVLPGEGDFVPAGAGDLKFQKWLQESQWWPTSRHVEHQLHLLVDCLHTRIGRSPSTARASTLPEIDPHTPITLADWRRLPILSRKDAQQAGDQLASSSVPAEHGPILTNTSSGSTGAPVSVQGTTFDAWIFKALNLRHFLWHPHDFTGKFVAIRHVGKHEADYPAGARHERWGDSATFPFATGPATTLSISASISEQAQWLARQDPDYLLSYPSNLLALARYCKQRQIALPHLEQVETMGEVVNADVREAVRDAWDAP